MKNATQEENANPQVRCAIYARSATGAAGSIAIENQIRSCREFAESKGWQVMNSLIHVDAQVSGLTNAGRNGLAILEAAFSSSPHPIDYVLIEQPSRLSRNLSDLLAIVEDWRLRFGVDFYFVVSKVDTRDDAVRAMITMSADCQVPHLSSKVRRGMQGRVLQGFSVGGRRFGYRSVEVVDAVNVTGTSRQRILGYRLQVIESEATTVGRIFNFFADGLSTSQIAAKLNDELVPRDGESRMCVDRTHWNPAGVKRILLNPLYVGKLVWNRTSQKIDSATGKTVTTNNEPGKWFHADSPGLRIVSDELWSRVQNRMADAGQSHAA